jgi:hypothetical protein
MRDIAFDNKFQLAKCKCQLDCRLPNIFIKALFLDAKVVFVEDNYDVVVAEMLITCLGQ